MYQYIGTIGLRIINKSDWVVNTVGCYEYFDSPFVADWWHINDETGEADINKDSYLKYTNKLDER